MGRIILKVTDDNNKDYYLEWSTVVDDIVTEGMSLEKFKEYYKKEYGERAYRIELEDRLKRVEQKGTSSMMHDSVEKLIKPLKLTKEQFIGTYCNI